MQNTIFLQKEMLSDLIQCPYLPEMKMRVEYMFILKISKEDFNILLEKGWRRFGYYFFRPKCPECKKCKPIRVKTDKFRLSSSQKRVLKKNINTNVLFSPLKFSEELYEMYKEHSILRFNQNTNVDDYRETFFTDVIDSKQSEFFINNDLAASGFLDISSEAASSSYFYFKNQYADYSPGTFGALKEIEFAQVHGLKYYYLGYFIKENKSMSYKSSFRPYELFEWSSDEWHEKD